MKKQQSICVSNIASIEEHSKYLQYELALDEIQLESDLEEYEKQKHSIRTRRFEDIA